VQLSNRQVKLGLHLLSLDQATTTKRLAARLNVSIRTVKTDLKVVQAWLQAAGDYYRAKPRVGIWLVATSAQRASLKAALMTNQPTTEASTPQERISQLGLLLAVTDRYLTTQQLENRLGISKNTVINDLNKVERYLADFQVKLERKNYYGYRLIGAELNLRSVLEALLNQLVRTSMAANLTDDPLQQLRQLPLSTVPELQTILGVIIPAFSTPAATANPNFDANDQLTMIMRLAIIILRLSMHRSLSHYQQLAASPHEQAALPYQCFVQLMQHYDFPQLQQEYDYLLRGANPRFDDQNIARLTKDIIAAVSQQTGQAYDRDSQLQVNLFSHLLTQLSNKYKFTNEYNPFIADIQNRHPALYQAVSHALRTQISANPAVVNASLIVFVTLHFLVSIERQQTTRHARIIYVCSTGLGVTSLIKNELERQLTNIEIAGFASPTEVAAKVRQWQPDLVVSIFPLTDVDLPVIQVSPLPSPTDIQQIKAAVAQVLQVSPQRLTPVTPQPVTTAGQMAQSRALMLKGAVIYGQLQAAIGSRVPAAYQAAFVIHVMLAVQRISCQQSYDSQGLQVGGPPVAPNDAQRIRQIFKANQLSINSAEVSAILQYTRINDLTNKGAKQHG